MNLANKLTMIRIFLVQVFLVFIAVRDIPYGSIVATAVFIIASITDQLDGHIARSRNQITTFGKFLDPIADKFLVITAMILLVQYNGLPAWIPVIVIAREFLVSGYRLIAVEKSGKVVAASIWGKLKTATQMVAIALLFIDANPFGAIFSGNLAGATFAFNLVTTVLMSISIIATIFSGIDYLKNGKDLYKDK